MQEIFKTFRPKSSIVSKYVEYYYLDIKNNNVLYEFECFPHFNNSISLYKSHIRLETKEVIYDETAKPCQIFTPVREKVLHVRQSGKVYRIVVVFNPLGIQQFYENLDFSDYITDYEFFTQDELNEIFSTTETDIHTSLLDSFLEKRFKPFEHSILEKSIHYIFNHYEDFSVEEVSKELGVSRQHLNRLFQAHLGVSVKKFNEIVLFRQTIKEKLFENPDRSFTELAYEFNFNDQSHFNKTYKNLTKNSPKSFFSKGTVLGQEDTFWHLLPSIIMFHFYNFF
ncbi:helix-turn-helix domain-containing protein [Chryseobacterium jejuense]|uniref:AraC-type DNA-binding protein n=1 Tax=Chryseobacterium jejuense TaxID=445960 RepID=A0A2X2Z1V0_CHRJE|nr:AraC family transcriptional regulator [Chryseobacterium jejuense]SDI27209.1 AraC-type DNA-binding protein [Chryseobacterium jejuense]SQB44520.1 Bacillibactin transport regulator [Chryseobacterium jejuense]